MIEGLTFDERADGDWGTTRILIVDEHPLMRAALANVLAGLGERTQVLQADCMDGALAALATHATTALVLLDMALADEGANAIGRLRQARAGIPVVVLSSVTDRATVTAAIRAGAIGFISKRSTQAVLLGALRLVLAGEVYIPPEVLRMQPPERTGDAASGAPVAALADPVRREALGLTPRQLDVLALLVQGKPNKVICRELGLAEGTVKTHTAAIFRALRVSNRTEAGFAVSRLGIQMPAAQSRGAETPQPFGRALALSH